jgi:hypothetical protein
LSLQKIAWEALATREAKAAIAAAFGTEARVNDLSIDFDRNPPEVDATVLTPDYKQNVEAAVVRSLDKTLGQAVAVTIEQVRTSDGDSATIDLASASAAQKRHASRVARELALIAGVGPEQVMVDADAKAAQVFAARLPGADLAAYRELERRLASSEPGWRAILIPPPLPLPSIEDPTSRDGALDLAVWAASRLHLPLRLTGPADANPLEEALRAKGVVVERKAGRRPALEWSLPDEEKS